MEEPFILVAATTLVYTLFSFLLLGINYLFLRWTGADVSAGLLVFIYIIAVIVIMLPGLIAAIVLGGMIEVSGELVGLGVWPYGNCWRHLAVSRCPRAFCTTRICRY